MVTNDARTKRIDGGAALGRGRGIGRRTPFRDRRIRERGPNPAIAVGAPRRHRRRPPASPAYEAVPGRLEERLDHDGLDPSFDEVGELAHHLDGLTALTRPGWEFHADRGEGPGCD